MNHLVVFCHPDNDGFDRALTNCVLGISNVMGHDTQIRDLYRQNFNPVLRSRQACFNPKIEQDALQEQEFVSWADLLTLIYPVWWAGMPAMLKGYLDRVFCRGFAFETSRSSVKGLLGGRKVLIFSTTCMPSSFYSRAGMHETMAQAMDTGIFELCGMEVLHHAFFGGQASPVDLPSRQDSLAEVEAIASRYL